jgi:tol-pal system protein YbgF
MNATRLLFFGIVWAPVALLAQRKEDIQSLQRDVAQLQEQVKQLQSSQDQKMAAIQGMLQQTVDASNKAAAGLATLQHDLGAQLSAQQDKVVAPVASLGAKVDQIADDLRSTSTSVADLLRRVSALDSKLADMSTAVRTLSSPPPSPGVAPPGAAASATPGVSAEVMYQNAFRDYSSAKYELAMNEFSDFIKSYPDRAEAADAQYYIGYIYYNAGQFADAAKAFDAVDSFPPNPKTPEALYYRAVSLVKSDHRTDAGNAGTVFKEFLKRYPRSDHASQAHANLRALGLERSAPGKKRE